MVELRVPKFSDAGVAGFVSSFLNELAEDQPNLNRDIRLYCLCISISIYIHLYAFYILIIFFYFYLLYNIVF